MVEVTNLDIQEIKTTMQAIVQATEANTKAIATLSQEMRIGFAQVDTKFANVDTKLSDIRGEIKDFKASVDVKFANVDTKFANVDTKLSDLRGDIRELKSEAKSENRIVDVKFEERTKSFGEKLVIRETVRNNIGVGITNIVVGGALLALAKFLFFGTNT